VTPAVLVINNLCMSIPNIMLMNLGEVCFDLFMGLFTKNDWLRTLPFMETYEFISGIPLSIVMQVVPILNSQGTAWWWDMETAHKEVQWTCITGAGWSRWVMV